MGSVVRPRVVGFELCFICEAVIWCCRLRRGGTVAVDPRPVLGGHYGVLPDGRLRPGAGDPRAHGYVLHTQVCEASRRLSAARLLAAALEHEITQAVEEGRRPPERGQLTLLSHDPPVRSPRLRPGWVDLTEPYALRVPPRRPGEDLVIDLRPPPPRVRPS